MTLGAPSSCTETVGKCLTEYQARISNIDARCLCTGHLNVSGAATLASTSIDKANVNTLTAASILGAPNIPRVILGNADYSSNSSSVQLNGQELQASVFSSAGVVPLSLANGSTILMGSPTEGAGPMSYILEWNCNVGTFYNFINVGPSSCVFGISAPGTINSPDGTASTLTVASNQRGTIFKFSPTQWAANVQ
jgi:hypothetical protein